MGFFSSNGRRIGADILFFAAMLLLAAPLPAAVPKKSAPKKATAAPTKKAVSNRKPAASIPAKTKPVHRATEDEIRQAGFIASENADRMQSEKMDPTVQTSQAEERVHAWMKNHQTGDDSSQAEATTPVRKPKAPRSTPARTAAQGAATDSDLPAMATTGAQKAAAEKASSTAKAASTKHKATAADFDAAADAQSHAQEPQPTKGPRSAVSMPNAPTVEDDTPDPAIDRKDVPAEATVAAAHHASTGTASQLKGKTSQRVTDTSEQDRSTLAKAATAPHAVKQVADDSTADADDDDDAPVLRTAVLQHDRRGRLIVPAPMKGSHEILVHQNVMADHDGLDRIQDDDDLNRMRRINLLVGLPSNAAIHSDERLPANRRYARPWTVRFLADISRAHYQHFHAPLQINSAVRTVSFQRRLMLTNGNAAPPTGETASPHLTGQAIDLAKRGMSMSEIAWMRGYLLPLVQQGKIDVEEEFQQSCFHISVYRKYVPQTAPRRSIPARRNSSRLLAAGIR